MAPGRLPSVVAIPPSERREPGDVRGFHVAMPRIGYVSRPAGSARSAVNTTAMIDAAVFALLVAAIAAPVSWWGISRFG
jgi:hypothetical protein